MAQSGMMMVVLTIGLLFTGTSQATVVVDNEYYSITQERVEKALADGAEKKDIKLAEASLTALGWVQVYGSNSASADLARRLAEIVVKAYNGTDKMDTIYMKHTSEAYGEMLNLKRFGEFTGYTCAPEYAKITRERVDKALSKGPDPMTFALPRAVSVRWGGWTCLATIASRWRRPKS